MCLQSHAKTSGLEPPSCDLLRGAPSHSIASAQGRFAAPARTFDPRRRARGHGIPGVPTDPPGGDPRRVGGARHRADRCHYWRHRWHGHRRHEGRTARCQRQRPRLGADGRPHGRLRGQRPVSIRRAAARNLHVDLRDRWVLADHARQHSDRSGVHRHHQRRALGQRVVGIDHGERPVAGGGHHHDSGVDQPGGAEARGARWVTRLRRGHLVSAWRDHEPALGGRHRRGHLPALHALRPGRPRPRRDRGHRLDGSGGRRAGSRLLRLRLVRRHVAQRRGQRRRHAEPGHLYQSDLEVGQQRVPRTGVSRPAE